MPPKRKIADVSDAADDTPATKASKTGSLSSTWDLVDTVYFYKDPAHVGYLKNNETVKIASFDMDSTLIEVKSGAQFPKNADDWVWFYDNNKIIDKIQELSKDGYQIVIISNQKGVSKGKTNASDIQRKTETLRKEFGVPVSIMFSSTGDFYRKPSRCMWDLLIDAFVDDSTRTFTSKEANALVHPDTFYCGDAAGRQVPPPGHVTRGKYKKDFSDGDRAFAHNIGIKFYTPEEFFLGASPAPDASWKWHTHSVQEHPSAKSHNEPHDGSDSILDFIPSATQEIVITCGPPGTGKTRLAKLLVEKHGYVQCNRDELTTDKKMEVVLRASIAAGKSVILDNTFPQADKRKMWINIAKAANLPVRAVVFECEKKDSMYMAALRHIVTRGEVGNIPDVVFHMFYKNRVVPTKSEGFSEVITIDWKLHHPEVIEKESQKTWDELAKNKSTLGPVSKSRTYRDFVTQRL